MSNKITTQRFIGKGNFPIDMLRYDECWPSRQEDVMNIIYSEDRLLNRDEMIISISTHGKFTPDRWISLGWRPINGNK